MINLFWDAITLLRDKSEIKSFFGEILTPTEIRMLSKRFSVAKMLDEAYDYQTIRAYLNVTDGTISDVNNRLKYGDGGLEPILERLFEIEKKCQDKLEGKRDVLKPPLGGVDPFDLIELVEEKLRKRVKRKSSGDQG